jgi:hypothetical protein
MNHWELYVSFLPPRKREVQLKTKRVKFFLGLFVYVSCPAVCTVIAVILALILSVTTFSDAHIVGYATVIRRLVQEETQRKLGVCFCRGTRMKVRIGT